MYTNTRGTIIRNIATVTFVTSMIASVISYINNNTLNATVFFLSATIQVISIYIYATYKLQHTS